MYSPELVSAANSLMRYRISDWHQLPGCMSNNSRKLHLEVSDFVGNPLLHGLRIQLNHEDFGTLFACVLNCSGNIVDKLDNADWVPQLTKEQILSELRKFGYFIEYKEYAHLPGPLLVMLSDIDKLKYDKIRILNVWTSKNGEKQFKWHIVAFRVDKNPYWLNADYSPSQKEYEGALADGSAINVSGMTEGKCKWDWSWLYGYVANIKDILEENSH